MPPSRMKAPQPLSRSGSVRATPLSMTLAATAGPRVTPDGPLLGLSKVRLRAFSITRAFSASTGAANRSIQDSSTPEARERLATVSPIRSRCWISLGLSRVPAVPSPGPASRLVGRAAEARPRLSSLALRRWAFSTASTRRSSISSTRSPRLERACSLRTRPE